MIELRGLSKTYKVHKSLPGFKGAVKNFFAREYNEIEALKNVSFRIENGRITGLLGANGAGKTSLLKILSGLIYPTGGEVTVEGFTPYERKKEFKKNITFVMGQKGQLMWDLAAMQSYIMNKHIYEIDDARFQRHLNSLIEIFQARDLVNIQVRKLSFGQRMRVEIIGALLHNPKIVFLDEPTIGLDFASQNTIRKFVIEYNKQYGTTFIITSHNLNDIENVCNDIMIMKQGELIVSDSLTNVIQRYSEEKIVEITFSDSVDSGILNQFGQVAIEKNKAEARVEKTKIKELIGYCYENENVLDVNIRDIPLEVVIEGLMTHGESLSYE